MDSYISKEEIIELMRELVRSPSVNPPGDTSECAKIVLNWFEENSIKVEIIEGKKGVCNVVARLPGKNKGKVLLLNGHLDVVPAGVGWTVDPFGGKIRGGKMYGRGTSDMKSGIASMMAAMIAFKRSGVSFKGEIVFMGAADEETGSEFGTVYLLKKNIGTNADSAIVSEATNLRVELGNRGLRWIDVSIKGKSSHAAKPYLGINAIHYAAELIKAIHSIEFDKRNSASEIFSPSIAVTMIRGGTKENIIPDSCELTIDRRMIPGETAEMVMEELRTIIAPILKRETRPEIEFKMRPNYWDPYLISEDEPIVRATVDSFKQITGRNLEIASKAACTDASHLFHLGHIPTVLFGPGDASLSHKVDECVATDNLVLSTAIFIEIFNKLLA